MASMILRMMTLMVMSMMILRMAMMMFSLERLECTALPPCGPRVPPSPSQINGSHDDDDDGGCVLHCHSYIYKPIKKPPAVCMENNMFGWDTQMLSFGKSMLAEHG